MQKSLVVKNIDFELLHEQMMQLAELANQIAANGQQGLKDLELAVAGASQFFERLCNKDTEQKSLLNVEVDSIVAELKGLAVYFDSSKYAHSSEKLALKRAINFLECKPFPIKRNNP